MQITKFVDRDAELKILNEKWSEDTAQFIVIYGRRRVGKTELIKQFAKNKPLLYLLGRLESKKEQLDRISRRIALFFNDRALEKSPLISWDAVFEYLSSKDEKFIIALDEFPFFIKSSPELLSVIQDYWDNRLRQSKVFLIICGSLLTMMERYVFDYKMPIYGRRTLDLKLKPLKFIDVMEFFSAKKPDKVVEIYGVLGGTPAYILEFEKDLKTTIRKIILGRSFLLREPEFILREEVSEPRLFMSLLHAISIGKTKIGEIVNQTGIERGVVGKYLSIMADLNIVRREVPVTESWKSRKGLYFIEDNYFNFWFRFIFPNFEVIEIQPEELISEIGNEFNAYLSFIFEKVAKEFLININRVGELPFIFIKIGRWWFKEKEVDLVALNDRLKKIAFFEVKWSDLKLSECRKILKNLEEKSKYVDWFEDRDEYFGIIGKRIQDKEGLRAEGYLVWDLYDFRHNNSQIKNKLQPQSL